MGDLYKYLYIFILHATVEIKCCPNVTLKYLHFIYEQKWYSHVYKYTVHYDMTTLTNILSIEDKPGSWFNKNMSSYQYRKSHCGDKTVVRSSYLHNGISHTGKMAFLYWIRAQVMFSHVVIRLVTPFNNMDQL